MSTTFITHSAPSDFFGRVVGSVAFFFQAIGEGRRIAQRYESLSRLSDAALARRGIAREDLARIAVQGR